MQRLIYPALLGGTSSVANLMRVCNAHPALEMPVRPKLQSLQLNPPTIDLDSYRWNERAELSIENQGYMHLPMSFEGIWHRRDKGRSEI